MTVEEIIAELKKLQHEWDNAHTDPGEDNMDWAVGVVDGKMYCANDLDIIISRMES